MSESKVFTCIGCPIGCPLQLTHEGSEIVEIQGHACNRGAKYAKQEFADPRRGMTTTIPIEGARWKRVPVKVSHPISKERVMEAAELIHKLSVRAPVKCGQILIKDFLGDAGTDVVICRTMEKFTEGE